jgi:hypothetical protein
MDPVGEVRSEIRKKMPGKKRSRKEFKGIKGNSEKRRESIRGLANIIFHWILIMRNMLHRTILITRNRN